jgi:hypothetical protein
MTFEDERGYLIVASNNNIVNYVECARTLAKSIRLCMPSSKICLLTDSILDDDLFDYVREFPYGDQSADNEWKLNNDWQVFHSTPFRQTIKLEADMLVTTDISHWWTMLEHKDVVIALGCRDYKNNKSSERYYRKLFDLNKLPDVYNAITYWRYSKLSMQFFELVKLIFENWDDYKTLLKGAFNEVATTDVVYAMVAVILGVDKVTLPGVVSYPSIIHMKKHINKLSSDEWHKQLVWELSHDFRINTISQRYPFHYNQKEFATTIGLEYDILLGSD